MKAVRIDISGVMAIPSLTDMLEYDIAQNHTYFKVSIFMP